MRRKARPNSRLAAGGGHLETRRPISSPATPSSAPGGFWPNGAGRAGGRGRGYPPGRARAGRLSSTGEPRPGRPAALRIHGGGATSRGRAQSPRAARDGRKPAARALAAGKRRRAHGASRGAAGPPRTGAGGPRGGLRPVHRRGAHGPPQQPAESILSAAAGGRARVPGRPSQRVRRRHAGPGRASRDGRPTGAGRRFPLYR